MDVTKSNIKALSVVVSCACAPSAAYSRLWAPSALLFRCTALQRSNKTKTGFPSYMEVIYQPGNRGREESSLENIFNSSSPIISG